MKNKKYELELMIENRKNNIIQNPIEPFFLYKNKNIFCEDKIKERNNSEFQMQNFHFNYTPPHKLIPQKNNIYFSNNLIQKETQPKIYNKFHYIKETKNQVNNCIPERNKLINNNDIYYLNAPKTYYNNHNKNEFKTTKISTSVNQNLSNINERT